MFEEGNIQLSDYTTYMSELSRKTDPSNKAVKTSYNQHIKYLTENVGRNYIKKAKEMKSDTGKMMCENVKIMIGMDLYGINPETFELVKE